MMERDEIDEELKSLQGQYRRIEGSAYIYERTMQDFCSGVCTAPQVIHGHLSGAEITCCSLFQAHVRVGHIKTEQRILHTLRLRETQ